MGNGASGFFKEVGELCYLAGSAFVWALRPPYRIGLFFQQADFVGVGSLFIVLLTGLFTGLVFALQSSFAFAKFNATSLVGATVVLSLCG